MPFVNLDESRFPLVVATFFGSGSDSEFAAYLKRVEALWRPAQRYAMVLDATLGSGASARQRSMQARWLADHADALRRHNVGCAFVLTSAVVRGVATAVFWLQPMPMPYVICASRREAEAWCYKRLSEEGVPTNAASGGH